MKVIGIDASGTQIPDQSNSVFTISKPVLTVTSPNGGENWYVNSSHPITWTVSNLSVANYTIQYSINNGSTWLPVVTNVPAGNTSYPWTVPDTPTTQALVKVIGIDASGTQIPDQSNSVFTISKPMVTVISPNGGENWYVNSTKPITWTVSNLSVVNYTIQYSINNGSTWTTIVTNVTGTDLIYFWDVPDTPTTQALVKVIGIDAAGTQVPDQSNSVFTISKPVVTVVTPNGGENWYVNSSHLINWTVSNLTASSYTIKYSTNNGGSWTTIASGLPANSTSYNWTVPDTPTTQALVQVTAFDAAGNQIPDESNYVFTISKPLVTVTSPNGGERWLVNLSHPITWTTSNLTAANFTVLYSLNNGGSWTTIATNVAGTSRSVNWVTPNITTTLALVKVIAYDSAGNQIPDQSDSVFTLYRPDACIGGRIFVTDATTTVTAQYIGSDAGFTNEVSLYSPRYVFIARARSTPIGTNRTIGTFSVGTELIFADDVSTGDTFYTGPANRNQDGYYHAMVTQETETRFRVGFEDMYGGGDLDYNDIEFYIFGNLSIVCPNDLQTLQVLSPNGGENWVVGSNHTIRWSTDNITPNVYKIEYSRNNGTSWTTLNSSYPGNLSYYPWTIPNTTTTNALVRITGTDAAGTTVVDRSDRVFTISAPSVTVTSPNGGETWIIGSTHSITWNATDSIGVTGVRIEYTTNGGTTWLPITNMTSNQGTYSWIIPNAPTTTALVRVTTLYGSNSATDQSNAYFTIAKFVAPDCGASNGTQYGRIVATKFNDLNGNAVQDLNEPNIAGWEMSTDYEPPTGSGANLSDINTTNSDGYYCSPCIKNGRWFTVAEADASGWTHTNISAFTDKMVASDPVQYKFVYFANKQVI